MLVGDNYYQLRLSLQGSSTSAYIYLNLASNGSYVNAAMTLYPSSTSSTYFNFDTVTVQLQIPPAASLIVGTNVITSDSRVAGTLGISPAVNVAATLQLYGNGGLIGTVTLPAGQTQIPYDFSVSSSQAFASQAAASASLEARPAADA